MPTDYVRKKTIPYELVTTIRRLSKTSMLLPTFPFLAIAHTVTGDIVPIKSGLRWEIGIESISCWVLPLWHLLLLRRGSCAVCVRFREYASLRPRRKHGVCDVGQLVAQLVSGSHSPFPVRFVRLGRHLCILRRLVPAALVHDSIVSSTSPRCYTGFEYCADDD